MIKKENRQYFNRYLYGDIRKYYYRGDILPYKDMYEYDDFVKTVLDEALFCQCAEYYHGIFYEKIDLANAAFSDFFAIKYGWRCPFNLRNINDNIRRSLEDIINGNKSYICLAKYYYMSIKDKYGGPEILGYTPLPEVRMKYENNEFHRSPIDICTGSDGLPKNQKIRDLIIGPLYVPNVYVDTINLSTVV